MKMPGSNISGRLTAWVVGAFLAVQLLISPAAARDAQVAPALWKIDGEKGDIYLFGSIHILPANLEWRSGELDRALNSADRIHFEVDLDKAQDQAVMRDLVTRFGFLPAGTTLRSLLAPEYRTRIEAAGRDLGLPVEALDRMRPWLAALTLTTLQAARQMSGGQGTGASAQQGGVDLHLWNWGKANGKSLGALETVESQIQLFANLSREQEVQYLVVTLNQNRQLPTIIDNMLSAWKKGETKKIDSMMNADMDMFPALRKALFDDRHAAWLPQIETMLADGQDHVVVVGTAHLVGRGSIVEMLRAKGIKVEGP
jgi:uncharacterized protein YbaP (TraB family)